MKKLFPFLFLLVLLFTSPSHATTTESGIAEKNKREILTKASSLQIPFIENKGQIKNQKVKYYAKTLGGTVFVEEGGVLTYSLPVEDKKGVVIKEIFSEKMMKVTGSKPSAAKVNYFIGKEKSNWRSNLPSYESISLGEIYEGIHLTLKAHGNNVEKLFTVSPGENPGIIRVKLAGAKGLKINDRGELEVITELDSVKFTKPMAYQRIQGKKKAVDVAYLIGNGNTYGFQVGNYDKKKPLGGCPRIQ